MDLSWWLQSPWAEGEDEADEVLVWDWQDVDEQGCLQLPTETTDATYKRGSEAIMSFIAKATKEFDSGNGVFMPDWEVLL